MFAEVGQLETVADGGACCPGDQDLTAEPGRGDPRGVVHVAAHVAPSRQRCFARMQAHANADRTASQADLGLGGSGQSMVRIGEGVEERVALAVDFDAAVVGECATHDCPVLIESKRVAFGSKFVE